MKLRVRIISIILVVCALGGAFVYARSDREIFEEYSIFNRNRTTVRIWYTDDALTPFLQSKAVAYSESNNRVRIEPTLVSGLEYLEAVNRASVDEDDFPDLYIITNDSLEKAYMAGLASPIDAQENYLSDARFPAAAINSITYKGRQIAYPFYFETSTLVYNKTYLENMATENLQSELDLAEGEAAQEAFDSAISSAGDPTLEGAIDSSEKKEGSDEGSSDDEESADGIIEEDELPSEITQEEIEQYVMDSIPVSISEILTFADNYNAPEEVEAVFEWDVTDIFYNYFFVGNYMNVGGDAGDDVNLIDIYNPDTMSCMRIYQQLNQFFAIDPDEISYDKVVQDFIDGLLHLPF